MKVRHAALLAVLAACAVDPAPVLEFDLVDLATRAPTAEHDAAIVGWAELGIVRREGAPLVVYLELVPGLEVDGVADRGANVARVRAELEPFRRMVVIAHEVGHVVLDAPEHGTCGIMGAVDVSPCDDDRAIACARVSAC